MSSLKTLIEQISNTFLEIERTKMWLEERGETLEPRIEAERYRDLAQKIHVAAATREVMIENVDLLRRLND